MILQFASSKQLSPQVKYSNETYRVFLLGDKKHNLNKMAAASNINIQKPLLYNHLAQSGKMG